MILRAIALAGVLLAAAEAAAWECITVPTVNRFRGASDVLTGVITERNGSEAVVRVTRSFKGGSAKGAVFIVQGAPGNVGDEILLFGQRRGPLDPIELNPCSRAGLLSSPEMQQDLRELRSRARWWRVRY